MEAFKVNWKTVTHMSFGGGTEKSSSYTCQRDNELNVQRESNGARWYYFFDNDENEYSEKQFYEKLAERAETAIKKASE